MPFPYLRQKKPGFLPNLWNATSIITKKPVSDYLRASPIKI